MTLLGEGLLIGRGMQVAEVQKVRIQEKNKYFQE